MKTAGVRVLSAMTAVIVLAVGLSGCRVAKAGAKCATRDWGRDSSHILQCRGGRWTRVMTIADYLRLVEASRQPAPSPTPETTTTTAAPTGPAGGTDPAPTTTVPITTTTSTTTSTTTTTTTTSTTSTTTTTQPPGFTGVFATTPQQTWRVNGQAFANVIVGNTVYVGGDFTTATSYDGSQSAARANLAAFDLTTGELRTSFVADTNGMVRDLASDGNRLYVAGDFTTVNGSSRSYLAAVSLADGSNSSWAVTVSHPVTKLAIGGDRLYLGGYFSWVGGEVHNHVAAVSRSSANVVSSFDANIDAGLSAIAASSSGDRVYVGGAYTMINGLPATTLNVLDENGDLLPVTFERAEGAALDIKVVSGGSEIAIATNDNLVGIWNASSGDRRWRKYCQGDGQAVAVLGDWTYGGFHDDCDDDPLVSQRWLLTKYDQSRRGEQDLGYLPTFDQFWGIRDINGDASVMVISGEFNWISGVHVGGFAIFHAIG